MVCTTALAICCQPARAEEREWKPRRHYRKMGERYTDKWAYELAEVGAARYCAGANLAQCRTQCFRATALVCTNPSAEAPCSRSGVRSLWDMQRSLLDCGVSAVQCA